MLAISSFFKIKYLFYFLSHYFIRNPDYRNSLTGYTVPQHYGKFSKLYCRNKIFISQSCRRLAANSLRSVMIIQRYFRFHCEKIISSQYSGGSETCFLAYCNLFPIFYVDSRGFFSSHTLRIFVFFKNISDGFMGNT